MLHLQLSARPRSPQPAQRSPPGYGNRQHPVSLGADERTRVPTACAVFVDPARHPPLEWARRLDEVVLNADATQPRGPAQAGAVCAPPGRR